MNGKIISIFNIAVVAPHISSVKPPIPKLKKRTPHNPIYLKHNKKALAVNLFSARASNPF